MGDGDALAFFSHLPIRNEKVSAHFSELKANRKAIDAEGVRKYPAEMDTNLFNLGAGQGTTPRG